MEVPTSHREGPVHAAPRPRPEWYPYIRDRARREGQVQAVWNPGDGRAVVAALREALAHPVERPFDPARLSRKPPILKASKGGAVTIPEDDEPGAEQVPVFAEKTAIPLPPEDVGAAERKEARAHTEVQWLLLKLGNDMGLDVWVARNDRGQGYAGHDFASLPRLKRSLPLQFDEATTRTIELIDVLWLRGNSIRAAFEIESTTSIFSGLLRMSDLITMQPNLNIPLYIVAPGERRDKVVREINRPTFARLSPPMSQVCRFISFEELRRQLELAKGFLQYLRPEFLGSTDRLRDGWRGGRARPRSGAATVIPGHSRECPDIVCVTPSGRRSTPSLPPSPASGRPTSPPYGGSSRPWPTCCAPASRGRISRPGSASPGRSTAASGVGLVRASGTSCSSRAFRPTRSGP